MNKALAGILAILCAPFAAYAQAFLAGHLTSRDVHIDVPLSNICVEAFDRGNFVGPMLFPVVPVAKQSGNFYVIGKNQWLRIPQSTVRAPKTSPRRVEFNVSSDTYNAINYALAGENAFEVLDAADNAIALRARTARKVLSDLMMDMEVRIANKCTSITNLGSGVSLTGTNKWSDYVNSDPIGDVSTGHAFIRNNTGVVANTMLMDWDTHKTLRRHPVLLDMYKYTQGGLLNDAELKEVFEVENLIVSRAIRNAALEGGTASIVNVWGNNMLLAHVQPGQGMETVTFGLGFRYQPAGFPAPFAASVYNDPDPGKKTEIVEVGYFQDEKIVAQQLSYLVGSTL